MPTVINKNNKNPKRGGFEDLHYLFFCLLSLCCYFYPSLGDVNLAYAQVPTKHEVKIESAFSLKFL